MQRRVRWKKLTPAVPRRWLWLLAGLVWSGAGIVLCVMAGYWLSEAAWPFNVLGAATGLGAGILIYRFGFSRIAGKNINRISQQPHRVCLFAFQAWRSYALIVAMMLLGYGLRHSLLPRLVLGVIYSAIGTGLALSSSRYYEKFL
jgi:hypothetical protein